MNQRISRQWAAVALAIAALGNGCTMKSQDAPKLTGPSELGTSVSVSVSPDVLTQDGGSQSLVTVTACDQNGKPLSNVSLRSEIQVGGVIADFGTLSARSIVTGTDGRATLVYTAPAAPGGPAVDNGTIVNIAVTPIGTDYANSTPRIATIRLVPPGVVVPPDGLQPYFTFTPNTPDRHQTVLFDASDQQARPGTTRSSATPGTSATAGPASGRTASHAYDDGRHLRRDAHGLGWRRPLGVDVAERHRRGRNDSDRCVRASPTADSGSRSTSTLRQPSRRRPHDSVLSWDFGDGEQKTTTTPARA